MVFGWSSFEWNASRHGNGPDDAYILPPPSCVGLDNEDS